MFSQDRREDCYEARLRITDVDAADSRNYYLSVENDRGSDKYGIHLAVRGSYPGSFLQSHQATPSTPGLIIDFPKCNSILINRREKLLILCIFQS